MNNRFSLEFGRLYRRIPYLPKRRLTSMPATWTSRSWNPSRKPSSTPAPPNLRRAHQALDRAVDRLYRPGGFASERERVEYLFMLYEKMRAPLEAARQAKPRRRTRRSGI